MSKLHNKKFRSDQKDSENVNATDNKRQTLSSKQSDKSYTRLADDMLSIPGNPNHISYSPKKKTESNKASNKGSYQPRSKVIKNNSIEKQLNLSKVNELLNNIEIEAVPVSQIESSQTESQLLSPQSFSSFEDQAFNQNGSILDSNAENVLDDKSEAIPELQNSDVLAASRNCFKEQNSSIRNNTSFFSAQTNTSNPNVNVSEPKNINWKFVLGCVGAIVTTLLAVATIVAATNIAGLAFLAPVADMLGKLCSLSGVIGLGASTIVAGVVSSYAMKSK